jgi:hypothetical protein
MKKIKKLRSSNIGDFVLYNKKEKGIIKKYNNKKSTLGLFTNVMMIGVIIGTIQRL